MRMHTKLTGADLLEARLACIEDGTVSEHVQFNRGYPRDITRKNVRAFEVSLGADSNKPCVGRSRGVPTREPSVQADTRNKTEKKVEKAILSTGRRSARNTRPARVSTSGTQRPGTSGASSSLSCSTVTSRWSSESTTASRPSSAGPAAATQTSASILQAARHELVRLQTVTRSFRRQTAPHGSSAAILMQKRRQN